MNIVVPSLTQKQRIECILAGHLGGSVVERLPLAQIMILGSWDPGMDSCIKLPSESLLLPLLMSLPLSVCLL